MENRKLSTIRGSTAYHVVTIEAIMSTLSHY
uniref:Uncharacterized protein n=1 Tax=Tetranychus urticae TaxID=32264 RepID=T1KLB9_TETUR